jgi:hypothetical protein
VSGDHTSRIPIRFLHLDSKSNMITNMCEISATSERTHCITLPAFWVAYTGVTRSISTNMHGELEPVLSLSQIARLQDFAAFYKIFCGYIYSST